MIPPPEGALNTGHYRRLTTFKRTWRSMPSKMNSTVAKSTELDAQGSNQVDSVHVQDIWRDCSQASGVVTALIFGTWPGHGNGRLHQITLTHSSWSTPTRLGGRPFHPDAAPTAKPRCSLCPRFKGCQISLLLKARSDGLEPGHLPDQFVLGRWWLN